jgi:uncharacterized membrane protein
VFFGGKEPSVYWHNGFFWVKLALFGVVFALGQKWNASTRQFVTSLFAAPTVSSEPR